MIQAVILLEVGIVALSFGIVMARRGYVTAHNCLSLRKASSPDLTMKGKPLLRFGMRPPVLMGKLAIQPAIPSG